MALNLKQDHWAYDLSKNIISDGEVFDEDVINLSLESILSTSFGERVFNPLFGSTLPTELFEGFNNINGEKLIDEILNSIEMWEDRIVVDKDNVEFNFISDENTLEIFIPYVIIKQRIKSFFNKQISL